MNEIFSVGPFGPAIARLRVELGIDELGERVSVSRRAREAGVGRKASEALIEFAIPVLLDAEDRDESEAAFRVAELLWNEVEPDGIALEVEPFVEPCLERLADARLELEVGRLREWIELLVCRRALFEDRRVFAIAALELGGSNLQVQVATLRPAAAPQGSDPDVSLTHPSILTRARTLFVRRRPRSRGRPAGQLPHWVRCPSNATK